MLLLPYKTLTISSKLGTIDILSKLSDITETRWTSNTSKRYVGKFNGNNFKIERIIKYRNTSNPVIKGEIVNLGTIRELRIIMHLNLYALIFMLIWFSITIAILIVVLIGQFNENSFDFEVISICLIFIFAGYLMMILGFKAESSKFGNDIKALLSAK